jgi:hypothetical protein
MAKPRPAPGSARAQSLYRRYRLALVGGWLALPIIVGALIVFWSTLSLVILIVVAATIPSSVRSQRRTLKRMRENAHPGMENEPSGTKSGPPPPKKKP